MDQDSPGGQPTRDKPCWHCPQCIRNLNIANGHFQAVSELACIHIPGPVDRCPTREGACRLKELTSHVMRIGGEKRANDGLSCGPFDFKLPSPQSIWRTRKAHRVRVYSSHNQGVGGQIMDHLKYLSGKGEANPTKYPSC